MTIEDVDFEAVKAELEHQAKLAWCGGYLCARGGFTIHKGAVKLQLIGDYDLTVDDLLQLKEYLGLKVSVREQVEKWTPSSPYKSKEGKLKAVLVLSGETLHNVMLVLWPYLSVSRKYQYNLVRRKLNRHVIR